MVPDIAFAACVQVYGGANSAGHFDAVLTCFFLDTAHNVLVRVQPPRRVLFCNPVGAFCLGLLIVLAPPAGGAISHDADTRFLKPCTLSAGVHRGAVPHLEARRFLDQPWPAALVCLILLFSVIPHM